MTIQMPDKARALFEPRRYKVLHGGRGSGKSWSAARALLALGASRPMRILCARELQNSIRDSVHKLLSDQIAEMGLSGFYSIDQTTIRGRNGTEFFFEGLKSNVNKVKSYEGIDVVWVEEANLVSKQSWDILIPTVRKEGSEIWVTFNPELEDDETYRRFVTDPPPDALVVKMTWRDNPWFPEVLRLEKDDLYRRDEAAYRTVWEGECRKVVDGAIFAEGIMAAEANGRIRDVPYDKSYPVTVSWDLGWGDQTSLWFAQRVGNAVNFIDFYQNNLKDAWHYVEVMQRKGYIYKENLLPHDAEQTEFGTGYNIREVIWNASRIPCRVVTRMSKKEKIDAGRRMLPMSVFDSKKCADGLSALRRHRYAFDEATGKFSREPLHDISSNAADSFMYMAIGLSEERNVPLVRNPALQNAVRRSRYSAVVR